MDIFNLKKFLTENRLTRVSQLIGEAFSLEDIKRQAEENSKEGYVVHVNRTGEDSYKLSDWYDADTTVASYENGRSLNEWSYESEDEEYEEVEDVLSGQDVLGGNRMKRRDVGSKVDPTRLTSLLNLNEETPEELPEAKKQIATTYQLTPRQVKVLKDYGSKESTSGRDLYISQEVYKQLQDRSSAFKLDFASSFPVEDNYLASQIITALKKSISRNNTATINNKPYYVLKGHLTANNFYFDNPYRTQYKLDQKTEEDSQIEERKKNRKHRVFNTKTHI